MLKYRLIFGTLMVAGFAALMLGDGWVDGSLSASAGDKPIQGTGLCILIILTAIGAQLEMASLVSKTGAIIFKPIAIVGAILLATSWYWRQFSSDGVGFQLYYVLFVSAFLLLGVFGYQGRRFGTDGVVANCAVNYFSIFYLGFLSSFILGMRIDFGLWPLLMFVFTVKSSDIGAYAIGRLFGAHKFSPNISPGKTWEGLAGAVASAAVVAVVFSACCGIMAWWQAAVFGAIFAVGGQLGDLAESMIKRDAAQKDSAGSVPGFGGILDIIDSPIATAPAAYLFFMLVCN